MIRKALLAWLLLCVPAWADIDGDLILHVAGDNALTDTGSGSHTVTISSGTADYDGTGNPVGAAAIDVGANSRYPIVTDAADLSLGASNADGAVALWSKTSVTGVNQAIFSQYAGFSKDVDFLINASNHVQAVFRGTSTANCNTSGPNVCDGVWHHIAIVWTHQSGTTFAFAIYVDGSPIYTSSLAWTPEAFTADLCLGARPGGTAIHGGQIDDVRVYSGRALTADEVVDLVALGPLTRLEVAQKGHWALNETSGTTAADSSGNGNDGTYPRDASNTTTASVGGSLGTAYALNGTSDFMQAGTSSVSAYPVTIAGWYYSEVSTGTRDFFNWRSDTNNFFRVGRTITTQYVYADVRYAGTVRAFSSTHAIVDGWQHIVAVFESATSVKIYVSGVLVASDSGLTSSACPPVDTFNVGANQTDGTFHAMRSADVRLYARALTADEIVDLVALGPLERLEVALKSHHTLDDTSGTTCVAAVGTNGTYNNSPTLGDPSKGGSLGTAVTFNGSNQTVSTASFYPVTGTSALSTSIWFKTSDTTGALVEFGNATAAGLWLMTVESGVIWERSISGVVASWGTGYDDDAWHHLVLTKPYAGTMSSVLCYVDGSLVARTSLGTDSTINLAASGRPYKLADSASSDFFAGTLDDPRIYARQLSADDVAALYAMGTSSAKPWLLPAATEIISRRSCRQRVFTHQFDKDRTPCYALAP